MSVHASPAPNRSALPLSSGGASNAPASCGSQIQLPTLSFGLSIPLSPLHTPGLGDACGCAHDCCGWLGCARDVRHPSQLAVVHATNSFAARVRLSDEVPGGCTHLEYPNSVVCEYERPAASFGYVTAARQLLQAIGRPLPRAHAHTSTSRSLAPTLARPGVGPTRLALSTLSCLPVLR